MYDQESLVEKLQALLEALERMPRRFSGIDRTITSLYLLLFRMLSCLGFLSHEDQKFAEIG